MKTENKMDIGLSKIQSEIYLYILGTEAITAREVSNQMNIDRVFSYRLLEGLVNLGLLEVSGTRPRTYSGMPIKNYLNRTVMERRILLEKDQEIASELSKVITLNYKGTRNAKYKVLSGTEEVYSSLYEMVESASESIYVLANTRGLRKSIKWKIHEGVRRLVSTGGEFKLVAGLNSDFDPTLETFLMAKKLHPDIQIRKTTQQVLRMTIVDHSEVLAFIVPEVKASVGEEAVVWTTHKEFVEAQLLYFEHLFNSSSEISEKILGNKDQNLT